MLPAKFRLKAKKEFSEIFINGKSFKGRYLLMKYLKTASEEKKIGFSVGVKFSKKATVRNKAKRWLREAARTQLGKIKPGSKIIFILSPKIDFQELNLAVLQEEMQNLLIKGKLT